MKSTMLLLLLTAASVITALPEKKAYIVYMGEKQHDDHNVVDARVHSFLANALGSTEDAQASMIHTYKRSFQGFSAYLTEEQAAVVRSKEGVISVFPSKSYKIHTTHSWNFLDTVKNFARPPAQSVDHSYEIGEADVIIGVLDTGIWPESASFKDDGMPPVPKKWKGICQKGEQFSAKNCNKKLIGARFYTAGFDEADPETRATFIKSARDSLGHGTHTSSTAAGRVVKGVSFPGGLGAGDARGGSPSARLAMYKVCWEDCKDADILAAFDDAIADGVDLLSLSLGPDPPQPNYFEDTISIGAFHAVKKNIVVSCSAGNSGLPSTAINLSPWILTVAASTIDRKFEADVKLGNGLVLQGQALNPSGTGQYLLALASSLAAAGVPTANASLCQDNTLDATKTNGKIVVCRKLLGESRTQKTIEVQRTGGVGVIFIDDAILDVAQVLVLPSSTISNRDGAKLESYVKSTSYPTVKILASTTVLNVKPSPRVAVFSSRGPNMITPEIIKPDVTAPGVTILAAWAPIATAFAGNRTVDFNFQSGTSMSCPHVTGVAALLKAKFPSWSPAMIKSAIMTTAVVADNTNRPIINQFNNTVSSPFDLGSGHVNPIAALDPGLVYDITNDEYLAFACGIGSPAGVKNLTSEPCTSKTIPVYNLNYPSIGVSKFKGKLVVTRTLTSVSAEKSYYKATVVAPVGVSVTVEPSTLWFTGRGDRKTFTVTFAASKKSKGYVFGSLTWFDGYHSVRSPIAVSTS